MAVYFLERGLCGAGDADAGKEMASRVNIRFSYRIAA